jgi:hypothetical protein
MLERLVVVNNAPKLGLRFYTPLGTDSIESLEEVFYLEFLAIVECLEL